jgi:hypothetical protein
MRSFLSIVAAPTLCLGVLAGIVWENGRHTRPADALPYHAAAKSAIDAWPTAIDGRWRVLQDATGAIPMEAVQLLKPNALLYREYVRPAPAPGGRDMQAGLLVVQCRDPEDMSGHYPPNCYPRNGEPLEWRGAREWKVGGFDRPISGTEYRFTGGTLGSPKTTVVYNFFVLPGRGFVADMEQVREASGDYQRRHYGATQVQVLFRDPNLDQATRDEAFRALIGAAAPTLHTLNPTGI